MTTASSGPAAVESVLRATRLLGCFRQGEPTLALSELVRRSGYSKTTTHRLLLTLERAGWLERDAKGGFRLSIRLFEIGSILVESLDLRHEGLVVMRYLAQQSGLSVHLVIAAGPRAVCLERVDTGRTLRIPHLEVGASQPLCQSAAPRVLLAHHEAALLPQVLRAGVRSESDLRPDPAETLVSDLADIRRRGYCVCDQDATPGLATLGAPVFDRSGHAVAGLGVCGLRQEVLPRQVELVKSLRIAATDLSARLGHPGSWAERRASQLPEVRD